jgi:Protein of unknown function (DUF3311)
MSPSRSTRKSPVALVAAGILLLAAVIASFWVPLYARTTPKLGSVPFFYWYQLLLVPAIAIASWIAYLLLRKPGSGTVTAPTTVAAEPSEPPAGPAGHDVEGGREAAL